MYNIHLHYENIFHSLKRIIAHRRLLYLLPYGSTQPENIETISDNLDQLHLECERKLIDPDTVKEGTLFIFYDQEPIYGEFNYKFFDHVRDNFIGPYAIVTTERDSVPAQVLKERYGWPVIDYFHHAFAAHDWFRGAEFNSQQVEPNLRPINKKFITFNRITSGPRVYRTLFINELIKNNLLEHGHVSYNKNCINNSNLKENLYAESKLVPQQLADEAIANIESCNHPFRIDFPDNIPNQSFSLEPVVQSQESFLQVVTETCFWEQKKHLTEKIFKPILLKQPFMLLGCAYNLEYLRSYGFQTFNDFWDENYDTIENPLERMQAVVKQLKYVCSLNEGELLIMRAKMDRVLQHNYNRFNDPSFLNDCWKELQTKLKSCV